MALTVTWNMEYMMESPISATFLIVCFKAQMTESRTSLNCGAGMFRSAGKQCELTAYIQREEIEEVTLHGLTVVTRKKCLGITAHTG